MPDAVRVVYMLSGGWSRPSINARSVLRLMWRDREGESEEEHGQLFYQIELADISEGTNVPTDVRRRARRLDQNFIKIEAKL